MDKPSLAYHHPNTFHCAGAWSAQTLSNTFDINFLLETIDSHCLSQKTEDNFSLNLDFSNVTAWDCAGAWLLSDLQTQLAARHVRVNLRNLIPAQQTLMQLIETRKNTVQTFHITTIRKDYRIIIAETIFKTYQGICCFLGFLGEFYYALLEIFKKPKRFQLTDVVHHLYQTGCLALGIVALLSFLIGIVLAYQMGLQLETYGANIYVVKITGVTMVREFAPLMVAVILAGRTTAAFTAEIGMMSFNAEIDALKVMGLSVMQHLVLPRIVAVFFAMPILIFWADIFGLMGSMVMAKSILQVNYLTYLQQFHQDVDVNHYLIGFIKAPVFACIIGFVGCFQGLQVLPSAQSIGFQTTKSVVLAIFFVIVADALFAIVFSLAGI
jgi:phospholipid/cholesterol/gamma-HCH transport system permease protein